MPDFMFAICVNFSQTQFNFQSLSNYFFPSRNVRKESNHLMKIADVDNNLGQRRRLSIAMELLKAPLILFMDEPLSGLDGSAAFNIMECVDGLAQAGTLKHLKCFDSCATQSAFIYASRLR